MVIYYTHRCARSVLVGMQGVSGKAINITSTSDWKYDSGLTLYGLAARAEPITWGVEGSPTGTRDSACSEEATSTKDVAYSPCVEVAFNAGCGGRKDNNYTLALVQPLLSGSRSDGYISMRWRCGVRSCYPLARSVVWQPQRGPASCAGYGCPCGRVVA